MSDEIYARIGAVIRSKRESLGLSQAQLAERLSLGRTSVTMIEQGSQSIQVHQFLRIAAALRSDPSELLADMAYEPQLELATPEQGNAEFEILFLELGKPVKRITRS